MHNEYIFTYLFFLIVFSSLSLLNLHFCGPVGVNLQDELLSLLVLNLDVTSLICRGHFQLNLDLSLSLLV